METMEKLREMACNHLDKIAAEEKFTNETMNDAYKLIDIVLDTYREEMLREKSEDDYYEDYSARRYPRGYSRGRGEWTANGEYSNRRYSREDGKAHMISRLERMASEADGMDRETLYDCIERMRRY